jgi:hypothetical protein
MLDALTCFCLSLMLDAAQDEPIPPCAWYASHPAPITAADLAWARSEAQRLGIARDE